MKTIIITLLLCFISAFLKANNEQQSYISDSINMKNYTQTFFDTNLQKLKTVVRLYLSIKLNCPSSYLDTILQKRNYNFNRHIPLSNNKSIAFWLSSDEYPEGIEWENGDTKIVNILVFFDNQGDSIYDLKRYIYKPICQNTWAFQDLEIKENTGKLYIIQYGGNRFGLWGAEFEFTFNNETNKWIHKKSNLYTVETDGPDYKKKKLIWSKKSDKKLPMEETMFSEYFPGAELEKIIDGDYD